MYPTYTPPTEAAHIAGSETNNFPIAKDFQFAFQDEEDAVSFVGFFI
ncbi:hypothetical protein M104_1145 [Bacteroides fragilis str. 1007-1-F |uniref:Uncharacterized protein n=2 Tax=Bacteroides fragilis TaxID=817 RepID=A0AAN4N4W3_BACFG|nr:hypothetical protein M101_5197 [Bacteroides fragilis str. 1007-1-F \